MPTTSDLDRLYSLLQAKTGIVRVRDVRLERIAMDRALEMRYHQGLTLDLSNPIQHEQDQLRARIFPWQPSDGATENATWHYYPPPWTDPIDGAVDATLPDGQLVGWWNSAVHREQLEDTRWTHWGNGIHFEDVPYGARRWYFITVFALPLEPVTLEEDVLPAGKTLGFHLTADGKQIHRLSRTLTEPTWVKFDDVQRFPGRGRMGHVGSGSTTGPMKRRWVALETLG